MSVGLAPPSPKVELSRRIFVACAIAIACAYIVAAWVQYSPAYFGVFHDDSLYFSAGKALASGEGAVLPSLPGSPEQTKYPPLYPWLLSLIWNVAPDFPGNVTWAWGLNLMFGAWGVLAAIALLRAVGCSRREALVLGTLFALNPHAILWGNLLLSDILFAALAMTTAVVADRAIAHQGREFWRYWAAAIVLSFLALLTRSLGIALIGGLVLYAAIHRRYVAAVLASVAAAPIAIKLLSATATARNLTSAELLPGFHQNMAYYTDYKEFWMLSVPTPEVFWEQTQYVLLALLKHPAVATFFSQPEGSGGMVIQAASVAISFAVIHGVYARAQESGVSSIHWMALCYLPIVLIWNFPLMNRFWLPFLPVLLAGAASEVVRLANSIKKSMSAGQPKDQRIAAGVLAVMLLALLGHGTWRYVVAVPDGYGRLAVQREAALEQKKEAYAWLKERAEPGTVISQEDGLLYLYSGLKAMRPITMSTEAFFLQSEEVMNEDLSGLGDTAVALSARYWLVSDDDYEFDYASEQLTEATTEILKTAPVVFESSTGAVRIHELDASLTSWAK